MNMYLKFTAVLFLVIGMCSASVQSAFAQEGTLTALKKNGKERTLEEGRRVICYFEHAEKGRIRASGKYHKMDAENIQIGEHVVPLGRIELIRYKQFYWRFLAFPPIAIGTSFTMGALMWETEFNEFVAGVAAVCMGGGGLATWGIWALIGSHWLHSPSFK